jgi:tRNA pseudouridine55 synthase
MTEKATDGSHDGFLVIDKPPKMTSHDVVATLRRVLGTKRVGHGGTLDPNATGVLIVAVGRATRLLRFLGTLSKSYVAEVVLGSTTTTLDDGGELVATFDMSGIGLRDVRKGAKALTGRIDQVPPMVSAVKVGGKRLYEIARQGIEIEREPRPVEVMRFDVEETSTPGVYAIAVDCSTGTYVRSLAADLGKALGGGAHLRALRRIAVGPFGIEDATPLGAVSVEDVLAPSGLVSHLARAVVSEAVRADVAHGKVLEIDVFGTHVTSPLAVIDESGELIAVYEAHGESTMKPSVVLIEPESPRDEPSTREER